jgi:hypothetical protein
LFEYDHCIPHVGNVCGAERFEMKKGILRNIPATEAKIHKRICIPLPENWPSLLTQKNKHFYRTDVKWHVRIFSKTPQLKLK